MSRRFWAGLMIVALLITGASAAYIYSRLSEQNVTTVPLQKVPAKPAAPAAAKTNTSTATASVPPAVASSSAAATATSAAAEPEQAAPVVKRNILFSLSAPHAREVFIIGDFNEWKREPMKRKARGPWSITEKLAPGSYEYMFVVDGRKIKDPNKKSVSASGKSLITVKPLVSKK